MNLVGPYIRAFPFLASVVTYVSFVISVQASSPPAADPTEQLRHVEAFAMGGIGVAGTMSEGERSLRNLLSDPAATAKLEGLLTKATPAGQLYALLGLHVHDRAAFEKASNDFHAPGGDVESIGGCIISHLPFKQLLDRIKAGQYDDALTRPAR
jgi:hypothetical protein